MCTYNGAQYVQEQLDSIATQTRRPDELIVCDDQSSDNGPEIVRAFAGRVPFPVRLYVNDKNLGFPKNFEQAIGLCSGDIIALADQDDVWHPCKLERLYAEFAHSPETAAVFSDANVVDAHLRPLGYRLWQHVGFGPIEQKQLRRGDAIGVLLKQNVVTGSTMAFRARFRELCMPIKGTWAHDGWIALLMAAVARLVAIEEPLISYRQHADNAIGLIKEKRKKPRRSFSDVYADRLARFGLAHEHLLSLKDRVRVSHTAISALEGKLRHLQVRAALPRSRWCRLPTVARELLGLQYHRYSATPLRSFRGDLLRPVPNAKRPS